MSGRNWLILLLLTVAAFAGLLVYGDLREVSGLLVDSPGLYAAFAAALGLALINYVLRYLRWLMYLRALGIRVPWTASLSVFAAGLALSITPGESGGVAEERLVKPARRCAGLHICAPRWSWSG